jgi:hypothetical protein
MPVGAQFWASEREWTSLSATKKGPQLSPALLELKIIPPSLFSPVCSAEKRDDQKEISLRQRRTKKEKKKKKEKRTENWEEEGTKTSTQPHTYFNLSIQALLIVF